jgi:hypothetical protein
MNLLLRLLFSLGCLLFLNFIKHSEALLNELSNGRWILDIYRCLFDIQDARQAKYEHFALVLRSEFLLQVYQTNNDFLSQLLLINIFQCYCWIVHDCGEENLKQMFLEDRLNRKLVGTLHSENDSVKYIFKKLIQHICPLEYLEHNLKEDCTLRIVRSNCRLC